MHDIGSFTMCFEGHIAVKRKVNGRILGCSIASVDILPLLRRRHSCFTIHNSRKKLGAQVAAGLRPSIQENDCNDYITGIKDFENNSERIYRHLGNLGPESESEEKVNTRGNNVRIVKNRLKCRPIYLVGIRSISCKTAEAGRGQTIIISYCAYGGKCSTSNV